MYIGGCTSGVGVRKDECGTSTRSASDEEFFVTGSNTCKKESPNSLLNNTLAALTNGVGQILLDVHPAYPFDSSEIPLDTAAHLKAIQRESPHNITAGLAESFKRPLRSRSKMLWRMAHSAGSGPFIAAK